MPKDLMHCSHVWVRVDRVRRSLEAPYTGPYLVLKRAPKYFVIRMENSKEQLISIDRLKPAHLPVTEPVPIKPKPVSSSNSSDNKLSDCKITEPSTRKGSRDNEVVKTRYGRKIKFVIPPKS